MWVTLFAFLALIVWMREDLYIRFMAHASLNGLICATGVIVIFMAFANAFKVQRAAVFLRRVEKFEENPTEEERQDLIHHLRSKASFIDTFNTQSILNGYKNTGFLIFDDNQARLIKSKVGQRAGHMRNTVQYIAGVLVMLGLIGTFWGLLETITSVGDAMGGITKSFSSGGDAGAGMLEFLNSISKPLQGMGIAFSASLFGLTGSLLGGLLNSFCAKGMDKFMENFGVWIDTRIPVREAKKEQSLNPLEIITQHNMSVVSALDTTINKFRHQAQQIMVGMSGVMTHFTNFNEQQIIAIKRLTDESRINVRLADAMESAVFGLRNESQLIRESLSGLPDVHREINDNVRLLHGALNTTQQGVLAGQERIAGYIDAAAQHQEKNNTSLNHLLEAYAAMVNLQERILQNAESEPRSQRQNDGNSKAIDAVLEMQATLQKQLNDASQWQDINPMHSAAKTGE
jgi:DNA segregation ATPase FtsK/SpoIIIE-like protein